MLMFYRGFFYPAEWYNVVTFKPQERHIKKFSNTGDLLKANQVNNNYGTEVSLVITEKMQLPAVAFRWRCPSQ